MNIHISASELAILTGHNTYRDKKELYVKYWKKYWKSDYEQTVAYLKTKGKKAKLPETSSETVQRIARENNVPVVVFSIHETGAFANVIKGKGKFTTIKSLR